MIDENPLAMQKKAYFIVRLVLFTVFFFIVDEFLTPLNDELILENWGIGLIGMMVFIGFYIIDKIKLFVFKINWFNTIMIEFFLTWVLSDSSDFLRDFLIASEAILRLFGLA